jgi:uncharacterized protein
VTHAALIEGASSGPQAMSSPCQSCGACCSFASDWPRFSTEDDAELDRIPGPLVAADLSGMRCDGNRCSALMGEVGVATACAIYELRPHVCRACVPGDEGCAMARSRFGLAELTL